MYSVLSVSMPRPFLASHEVMIEKPSAALSEASLWVVPVTKMELSSTYREREHHFQFSIRRRRGAV